MRRAALSLPGWIGLALLVAMVGLCVGGGLLGGSGRIPVDAKAIGMPPLTAGHLLGTDSLGRDMLALVVQGGQVSLFVGALAAAVALLLGIAVGVVSASGPRWLDAGLMRFVDIALTMPFLVVLIALRGVLEPSAMAIAVIIGIFSWMGVARVARSQVASIATLGYVRAARAAGSTWSRTMLSHVLPNALPPVIAMASFVVSGAIIAEATLSFLGLGVPRTSPSWGTVLSGVHREILLGRWWVLACIGGALVTTVAAINMLAWDLQRR